MNSSATRRLPPPANTVMPSTTEPTQDPGQNEAERDLVTMLQTPWDRIYAVSKDGSSYIAPPSLRGVPVGKLSECEAYYDKAWFSLDDFLAKESAEEALKKEYHERLTRIPHDKKLKDAYKRHQDNVSKFRKIREIFGTTTPYHPNQLMSKHHLPPRGLCEKEVMYKLACKISDLRVLHDRGELAMDPWDFLRWRIAKKAHSVMGSTWQSAQGIIRSVAYQICDDSGDGQTGRYEDRLLRKAILRSAQLQGRLASFGARNITKPHAIPRSSGIRKIRTASRASAAAVVTRTSHAVTQERRQRREALARPSRYQGVNAFRAQRGRGSEQKT